MSEELQQKLRNQLWTVANTLRGNMSASDFMYFSLGFIFYKYLFRKKCLRAPRYYILTSIRENK